MIALPQHPPKGRWLYRSLNGFDIDDSKTQLQKLALNNILVGLRSRTKRRDVLDTELALRYFYLHK